MKLIFFPPVSTFATYIVVDLPCTYCELGCSTKKYYNRQCYYGLGVRSSMYYMCQCEENGWHSELATQSSTLYT
jgi:hypothetical protein